MDLPRLYYISQASSGRSHVQAIERACQAGCELVQLRVKGRSEKDLLKIAQETREICDEYGVLFIMNDHVEIAKQAKADGIHLGQQDMPADEAREILGEDFIIGGTANSFDDIWRMAQLGVDYLGVGPFRYTETKENLAPILGLEGYADLIRQSQQAGITLPIYAIGGIGLEDIGGLMQTGIHGVAISGAISRSDQVEGLIKEMNNLLMV